MASHARFSEVAAIAGVPVTPTPTPTPGPIQLRAQGKKIGGINTSRLKWRGATSANMDIYRDGNVIDHGGPASVPSGP